MVKKTIRDKKGWVTFTFFPTETIETVVISGEWNDWIDEPMKMKKNGEYFITKILNVGYIYQFGYKINGNEWKIDDECPTVATPFFSHNSLLEL
ncbi:MAG: hypothetical protein M0P91_13625 [Sulfuricurvum sp.]|jgi:hypothetical protein|uniref:hypothetical protein n=1 Tax=Sulfuricurvum sp. TaxID=2025608 RepID=UPI0025FBB9F9|nr:hypothetical protein [Sulfuricurvum sp.]MCK9374217.1 hypothetical protein [Sulfuricurvum sp.]